MAEFGVNRAVPPRAWRLNKAPALWLRPLAGAPSLLCRRSRTKARTSGGWMGLLAVASRQRKLAIANGHPEMRTWIRPLLDAPLWSLRTASGGWLCARQPPKSPTRSGLGDDLSAPEFRRVGHG